MISSKYTFYLYRLVGERRRKGNLVGTVYQHLYRVVILWHSFTVQIGKQVFICKYAYFFIDICRPL